LRFFLSAHNRINDRLSMFTTSETTLVFLYPTAKKENKLLCFMSSPKKAELYFSSTLFLLPPSFDFVSFFVRFYGTRVTISIQSYVYKRKVSHNIRMCVLVRLLYLGIIKVMLYYKLEWIFIDFIFFPSANYVMKIKRQERSKINFDGLKRECDTYYSSSSFYCLNILIFESRKKIPLVFLFNTSIQIPS
jgi:hypothetical protein